MSNVSAPPVVVDFNMQHLTFRLRPVAPGISWSSDSFADAEENQPPHLIMRTTYSGEMQTDVGVWAYYRGRLLSAPATSTFDPLGDLPSNYELGEGARITRAVREGFTRGMVQALRQIIVSRPDDCKDMRGSPAVMLTRAQLATLMALSLRWASRRSHQYAPAGLRAQTWVPTSLHRYTINRAITSLLSHVVDVTFGAMYYSRCQRLADSGAGRLAAQPIMNLDDVSPGDRHRPAVRNNTWRDESMRRRLAGARERPWHATTYQSVYASTQVSGGLPPLEVRNRQTRQWSPTSHTDIQETLVPVLVLLRLAEGAPYRVDVHHTVFANFVEAVQDVIDREVMDDASASDFIIRLNKAMNRAMWPTNPDRDRGLGSGAPGFFLAKATCGHYEMVDGTERGDGGGMSLCRTCYDSDEYVLCEDVDQYHLRDNAYWSDSRDEWLLHPDDDDDGEESCAIRGWGENSSALLPPPEVRSTTSGDFTIGVELELELRDWETRNEFAQELAEQTRNIICKKDGSLSNDCGLELVFAPLTLETVRDEFDAITFPRGTTAWDNGDCGVHVHIDANAFSRLAFAKFYAFWNSPKNAAFIRSVAGRHPSKDVQAERYADTRKLGDPLQIVRDMKSSGLSYSRYYTVNVVPLGRAQARRLGLEGWDSGHHSSYGTAELRIFRASLRRQRFVAQVEMAHATVEFARVGSISDMTSDGFKKWLRRYGNRYATLQQFIGLRKGSTGTRAPAQRRVQKEEV